MQDSSLHNKKNVSALPKNLVYAGVGMLLVSGFVLLGLVSHVIAGGHFSWLEYGLVSLVVLPLCIVILGYLSYRQNAPLVHLSKLLEVYRQTGDLPELPTMLNDEVGAMSRVLQNIFVEMQMAVEEEKRAALSAEELSTQLNFVVNAVIDAVITIDDRGRISSFNAAAEEIFGYTEADVLEKNVSMLMPENIAVQHDGFLETFASTRVTNIIGSSRRLFGKRRNGDIFPLYLGVNNIQTAAGELFIGLIRDISQQVDDETAIKDGLTILESTLDATDNAILVTDNIGKSLRINKQFKEVWKLDFSAQDVEGKLSMNGSAALMNTIQAYIIEQIKDSEESLEQIKVLQASTINWHGELSLNDGRQVDCTSVYQPLEQGRAIRVWSFRDISQQVAFEAELRAAKEEAEAGAAAKSDFLATMSHEIRTPMNGILGMLGLLLNSNLDSAQKRKATIAKTSAESLLGLLNDVLDFSKIEAEKMDLEILDFHLRNFLGDFVESMAVRAQEKGLEIILDTVDIDQTMVRGDPSRLRQILSNLVGNAIKFSETGEVLIRARLVPKGAHSYVFECEVQDSGIGIPIAKQSALFQIFSQVDTSTSRKYGGTGLGLAICKRLSELMGGEIRVESKKEDAGSRFIFNVMLQTSTQSQLVVPNVSLEDRTILIVDNNELNIEILANQLRHWGANVLTADSGEAALILLSNRVTSAEPMIDVAFLDMRMPIMTGAVLGARIRAKAQYAALKLVMMTSMSAKGDGKHYAELGFNAYFPKPATTTDIFDALSVLIADDHVLELSQPLINSHNLREMNRESGQEMTMLSAEIGVKILLVEDNPVNVEVALAILEELGLRADVAGNGIEAIDQLATADPCYEVVLMDCQMPLMDGFTATKQIREGIAGDANIAIPIIAMTANAMVGDKNKCLAAGMSDYLSKPIDPDKLLLKIRQWALGYTEISKDTAAVQLEKLRADAVWNEPALLKRMRGKQERLAKLISIFLTNIPKNIQNLKTSISSADMPAAKEHAHAIKGVAANLSGEQLMACMSVCEKACDEGDIERATELLPNCIEQCDLLSNTLRNYLHAH